MQPIPFATVSALDAGTEPGRFAAAVHSEWTIGGKPNGGYLLAMLCRAAVVTGTHPHVLATSAHYLHSPEPGPVTIDVEVLRAGRSASQLRARMGQDGRPCVEALVTTSTLAGAESGPFWTRGTPELWPAGVEESVRIPGRTPAGVPVPIMEQVDLRMDPATLGFAAGRPSGRGELRGWLALPGGAAFDPVSLVFAVDAFPPATFDIGPTGWVPTLELTVYVRALPAPGPVRVLQRAHLIDGQKVDEACYVWDVTDRLVAHGTQLAGVRLG